MFELPPTLARLIAAGVWPSAPGPSIAKQRSISSARVRNFAAEESAISLFAPPFRTVAEERARVPAADFWERFGALDQLDPERVLIIGDFGLGSDSPVVLDFARCASNPPVLRLRWGPRGHGNHWVQGARDFSEFAAMLGLE